MKTFIYTLSLLSLLFVSCGKNTKELSNTKQPVYIDKPYLQDYAIKFYAAKNQGQMLKVFADRNDIVQVLTTNGLYRPYNGHFQIPGTLQPDITYRPMPDKKIHSMLTYQDQFIYLEGSAIFSNAWAGKLYSPYDLNKANKISVGKEFSFLFSNDKDVQYLKDNKVVWQHSFKDETIYDLKYADNLELFFLLTNKALYSFSSSELKLLQIYTDSELTCFSFFNKNQNIVLGTTNGYLVLNSDGKKQSDIQQKLPWTDLTTINEINGELWFGTNKGAFKLKEDNSFDYYFGERWIPGNIVKDINPGPDNSVLILTDKGLGQICFKQMTLEDKAMVYEKQVRQRHIRYGINSNVTRLQDHDLSTAQNSVADSDNLWTGMYLGSQLFRYLVTGSDEARQNCYEAFEAMERLHEINGIPGLFGRSFERRGYQEFRQENRSYVDNFWYDGYQGTMSWRHAEDSEWDWRASASSDQTVGQIFALTLIAEYIDDKEWQDRAVKLLDGLVGYIVENDFCLIDYNGLPSLWGRWHPQYVNRFDTMVGDRKICSSNIIAFLQTAYKFTNKDIYREKALELLNDYGYLENLTRPFKDIGPAPDSADGWSRMLSAQWNHSDDEMYFLGYWGLFPYALNDTLQQKYREAIKDHWEWERPEKNALWNFCYALTGASNFDLEESIWHLKEFPLDMVQFAVQNSHRKDIQFIEKTFWGQTTTEVLPPDERPELKHNRNLFTLDGGDRHSELSAGDTFLLPYWMGRFLGVISAPVHE